MSKKGYVNYTYESPIYPAKLLQENPDISLIDIIFRYVRSNYKMFEEYKGYIFKGPLDDLFNQVMDTLFVPRRELITIGMYVYPTLDHVDIRETIPIMRNIYYLEDVGNGFYRLKDIVKSYSGKERLELYHVYVRGNITLYQGKMGNFYLLLDKDEKFPRIDITYK